MDLTIYEQIFFSAAFAVFFASLSRECGGGDDLSLNGKVAKFLYGGFYAAPLLFLGHWLLAIPAAALGILFKVTGHGSYMDLGTWTKWNDKEKTDIILDPIFGVDPNFLQDGVKGNAWRDFCGLTITGIGVGIGTGAGLLLTGHYFAAFVITLTAALKGVAYKIGWTFFKEHPTLVGEYLTGFFGGFGLFFAVISLFP